MMMMLMLLLLLFMLGSVDNLLLQRKQKEQSNLSRDGCLTKITKHCSSMMTQITACSAVFARNMIEKEFGLPVAQITSGMPVHDLKIWNYIALKFNICCNCIGIKNILVLPLLSNYLILILKNCFPSKGRLQYKQKQSWRTLLQNTSIS